MTSEWTKEIPKQVGAYWFYGDAFTLGEIRDRYTELHLVQVKQASTSLVYIASGHFMENKLGWWKIAELPELPKEL